MKDCLRFAEMRANRRSLSQVNNRRGTDTGQSRGRKVVLKSILRRMQGILDPMAKEEKFNVGLKLCNLNKVL